MTLQIRSAFVTKENRSVTLCNKYKYFKYVSNQNAILRVYSYALQLTTTIKIFNKAINLLSYLQWMIPRNFHGIIACSLTRQHYAIRTISVCIRLYDEWRLIYFNFSSNPLYSMTYDPQNINLEISDDNFR